MARLFMSTLGTTRYTEVYYLLNGKKSRYTPFIQEALVGLLCSQWDEIDRIVIFCTEEAEKKNWNDKSDTNTDGNFEKGLQKRLRGLSLKPSVKKVAIKEGKSEEEIMKIFSTVTSQIMDDDEVILDVTHSFRSLPLLNTVIINYAKALKNITVSGIYYGAFEALGTREQVEKMEKEERLAHVFDLTPYDRLLDWSVAINEFVNYGVAERIDNLVSLDASAILKEKSGKDKTASSVKKLASGICFISQSIRSARCFEIEKINPLEESVSAIKGQSVVEPFNPLLDLITKKTDGFRVESPVEKCFEAVRWCMEHDLVPQGYIILRETVLSGLCRVLNRDVRDHSYREFLSALLNVRARKKPRESWTGRVKDDPREVNQVLETLGPRLSKLEKAFGKLTDPRNDFMHCGCRQSPMKHEKLKQKLGELFEEITTSWFYLARDD